MDTREFMACKHDIFYFIEKYVDLQLRPIQVDVINRFLDANTNNTENIVGHRGCGLTTAYCLYALWQSLFFHNQTILIVLPSERMLYQTEQYFDNLYNSISNNVSIFELRSRYKNQLAFENNSRVLFKQSSHNIRGVYYNTIFYDGSYMVSDGIEVLNYLHVGRSAKQIMVNTFYPLNENPLESIGIITKYHWYWNIDLTLEWYTTTLNSLGNSNFLSMYGCTRGNSNVEL